MIEKEKSNFPDELIKTAEDQIVEQSKRIEFYLTEYSIELLALKMRNGDFEVPAYQREFTWGERRKSRFVESVLMGLPIPFLFFWESPKSGKLEIVDGSQRLRTIEEFVLGDFALGDLEELSLLKGFRFRDLPQSRQRKVKNRSIRGIVLNEHADEQSRFDIFERINTGSKVANPAEVRRGAFGGPFLDLVISLSKEPAFIDLAPVSRKLVKERVREELVTRFFAYSDGLEDYKDRVAPFISDYTKKMNQHFTKAPEDIEKYRARFRDVVDFVARNFPWGFRRTEKGTATPKTRFEAIAIGSYEALMDRPKLADLPPRDTKWVESKEFKDVIGADGANAKSRLSGRIQYVKKRLLKD